jgi:glycosyltransferase involved in cell wall biosynthesis
VDVMNDHTEPGREDGAGPIAASACLFTIVSANYLHYALTLMHSARAVAPRHRRVVCLCERKGAIEPDPAWPFEVLFIEDLPIPDFATFVFRMSILELNTAVKPFVFEVLFRRPGMERVVYFDPDIRLFGPLDDLDRLQAAHGCVLTPHITAPIDDGRFPDEITFLQSGSYNLGFVALSRGAETDRLIAWWERRLRKECVVDLARGLFVDQKWMNLAPSLFEGVHICRNPGWNVAYWNLPGRTLEERDGRMLVNGEPLRFFHFSGIAPDGSVFSKHQDRYTMRNLPPLVANLARDYCAALRAHGADTFRRMPYSYGRFRDGTPIPDLLRCVFREHPKFRHAPEGAEEEDRLAAAVNERPDGFEVLTHLALAQYRQRPDLQTSFPSLAGRGEIRYAQWFVDHAQEQAHIGPRFIDPVRKALRDRYRVSLRNLLSPAWYFRVAYRAAWACRRLAYPFTTLAFRQQLERRLMRRAYGRPAAPAAGLRLSASSPNAPMGLNVTGYLRARSGVGEAARATLRAARAAGLPLAVNEFHVGCASEKEGPQEAPCAEGYPHPISLFQVNADQVPVLRSTLGEAAFRGRYNIGFWYWELAEFPGEWMSSFDPFDEIWVASSFCQRAISACSPIPVVCMPPGIAPEPDPARTRAEFGLPQDGYLFLTMADSLSFPQRKNPLGAIQAFERAFDRADRGVHLAVKVINGAFHPERMEELRRAADHDPRVILLDACLSRPDTDALLSLADAYVSLHRSEGFGLPLAEAMRLGTPAIGTGWSSNLEFMTPQNSMLVNHRLITLDRDIGPYRKGQVWADPDLDHAAACMRALRDDPALARRLGEQGRRDMIERFSPEAAGARMEQRLRLIQSRARK